MAWRNWCLHHSLLTYGVMTELYWQHLLPQPIYQEKLLARYGGVWVDDLDEYPAVTERWLQVFIDRGCPVVIAWNPSGKVRLGVGADPDRLILLRDRCPVVVDLPPSPDNLAYAWADTVVDWATNSGAAGGAGLFSVAANHLAGGTATANGGGGGNSD